MNQIPRINLEDFLSNDPERKAEFVKKLGNAFSEIGFVALKGHFLTPKIIAELYLQIEAFFKLPLEVKKKYEIPNLGGQRGYTSFGKEHAKGRKTGDLKEFWHFGQYLEKDDLNMVYPNNIIVSEIPEFNEIGKKAYQLLEKTALHVLRGIASYLELEEKYFDGYIKNGNSILRPIHYPPILEEPKEAERAAAHGDINLITLLMGAQGRGLQVKTNSGQWIDAIAEEDELMINIGDMLSRQTNNRLKSTIHRVINPAKEHWGKSRYSIPFFMHPLASMPLNCMEKCIDEENPKVFEDITAGEFLNERLIDLGLI